MASEEQRLWTGEMLARQRISSVLSVRTFDISGLSQEDKQSLIDYVVGDGWSIDVVNTNELKVSSRSQSHIKD